MLDPLQQKWVEQNKHYITLCYRDYIILHLCLIKYIRPKVPGIANFYRMTYLFIYSVLSNTINNSRLYSNKWSDDNEQRTGEDAEECCYCPIQGIILALMWRDWEILQKPQLELSLLCLRFKLGISRIQIKSVITCGNLLSFFCFVWTWHFCSTEIINIFRFLLSSHLHFMLNSF